MNELEKIDYTLKALHSETRERGMLNIISAFTANGKDLTIEELRTISEILKSNGYAVFQIAPRGLDMRGQITQQGIEFAENDSFSNPGISIINRDNTDEPNT